MTPTQMTTTKMTATRNVPDPNDRDRNVPDPNDHDQNDLDPSPTYEAEQSKHLIS